MTLEPDRQKCSLCSRAAPANECYCVFHSAALSNVKVSYVDWQRAIGEISWERYLERIIELKETGESAKEIARLLLSQATSNRGTSVGSS